MIYLYQPRKRNKMKTNILALFVLSLFFTSCSKNDNSGQNTPPGQDAFINTTSGSTWTYHADNTTGGVVNSSDYMVTSTDKDTSVNSRKYHIYSYSYGGSQYLGLSGNDYYQYDSIPGSSSLGGIAVERLYLKDNLSNGGTWKQDFTFQVTGVPIPIPLTVSNKIAEKGISRTVNGIPYANVTHVSTSISSSFIPAASLTSAIDSYYAPKYGLIENSTVVSLNYLGITEDVNIKTQLLSAVLK